MSSRYSSSLVLLFFLPAAASAEPALRLKTRPAEIAPVLQMSETGSMKRRNPARSHVIVQFPDSPTRQQLQALEDRGATVLQPVPDYGLLVSAPDDADFDDLGLLQSSPLMPREKISPLLQLRVGEEPGMRFLAEFHPDVEAWEAREIALREGLRIRENPDLLLRQLLVEGEWQQVWRLAEWDEVAYIFPASWELQQGVPVEPCPGALTEQGTVGQYVATIGNGWDGPGTNGAELTYSFEKLTEQLPLQAVEDEIERAMQEWANYARLEFLPGGHPTAHRNLNFLFARGNHGDPYPFDGPGRVLAHTFYPAPPNPEPIAGDVHFDEDEAWKVGARVDVFSIALHELGHALGLGHSDDPNAVMYPYYRQVTGLSDEDIAAILKIYAATEPGAPPAAPLQLTIESPSGNVTTEAESITISGSASGGGGEIRITWTSNRGPYGLAYGSPRWTVPSAPLSAGDNVITVTATDARQVSVSRSIIVHRLLKPPPPEIHITSPAAEGTYKTAESSILIRGTASHASGIARVHWATSRGQSGQASGTLSWVAGPIDLQIGSTTITVTAVDTHGASASQSLQVDREEPPPPDPTPGPPEAPDEPSPEDPPKPADPPDPGPDPVAPSLRIISPAGTNVLTGQHAIVLRGFAKDNVGVTRVTWTSNAAGSGTATGTSYWITPEVPLLIGANTITIRAYDDAGNHSWRSVIVTRR